MPAVIEATLGDAPFLLQWYSWGVFAAFLLALAVTVGIFAVAQRRGHDATTWKSGAAVAAVLAMPALLARLHDGFAREMRDSLAILAVLSMAALLIAVASAIAYALTEGRGSTETTYTEAYPHESDSSSGDSYSESPQGESSKPVPITGVSVDSGSYANSTVVDGSRRNAEFGDHGSTRRRATVVLNGDAEPSPGWLVVRSGPYAGQELSLKHGQTLIGRDGVANDHVVDDDAVSGCHLSIRYQDEQFFLSDLDTANGTTVNGKPAGYRVRLKSQDQVVVGTTRLTFVAVNDDDAPTLVGHS